MEIQQYNRHATDTSLLKGLLISLIMLVSCGNHSEKTNDVQKMQSDSIASTDNTKDSYLCDSLHQVGLPQTAKFEDGNDEFAIFINKDKKAKYDEEAYVTSLYVYNYKSKQLSKLLTTTEPDGYGWYKPSGENAVKCALSDIHAIYSAHLFPYAKKLLVSGCFDMRNDFSYIIDLDKKSVLCLPTNSGFVGFTLEEGYVIMQSYAYNTGVDENGDPKGGRHTVLSVFDENGIFIRSLDLEIK